TGRVVLVNGLEAWVGTPGGAVARSSQRYAPDVVHPDGAERIESFVAEPWPRWTFRLPDGSLIEHGLLVAPGRAATALYWRLHEGRGGTLAVRPLVSGRDYHALHHENPAFRFDAEAAEGAGRGAAEERRRRRVPSRLHRAADAYLVRRGSGRTIVAGYPWFTDWGRDTFIAMRGLCLATGGLDDARAILLEWAGAVSE